MANDATNTRSGTESEKVTCPICSTELRVPATLKPMLFGVAGLVTNNATPAHSGVRLSEDDKTRLARIAKDRANRFMISMNDVDFLLDLLTRFTA